MSDQKIIEETVKYESCIGVKEGVGQSLVDFIDDYSVSDDIGKKFDEPWKEHWIGMPEYKQEENPPYMKIYVSFRNKEDYQEYAKLVGQTLTEKTKSTWYPPLSRDENALLRWIED